MLAQKSLKIRVTQGDKAIQYEFYLQECLYSAGRVWKEIYDH